MKNIQVFLNNEEVATIERSELYKLVCTGSFTCTDTMIRITFDRTVQPVTSIRIIAEKWFFEYLEEFKDKYMPTSDLEKELVDKLMSRMCDDARQVVLDTYGGLTHSDHFKTCNMQNIVKVLTSHSFEDVQFPKTPIVPDEKGNAPLERDTFRNTWEDGLVRCVLKEDAPVNNYAVRYFKQLDNVLQRLTEIPKCIIDIYGEPEEIVARHFDMLLGATLDNLVHTDKLNDAITSETEQNVTTSNLDKRFSEAVHMSKSEICLSITPLYSHNGYYSMMLTLTKDKHFWDVGISQNKDALTIPV